MTIFEPKYVLAVLLTLSVVLVASQAQAVKPYNPGVYSPPSKNPAQAPAPIPATPSTPAAPTTPAAPPAPACLSYQGKVILAGEIIQLEFAEPINPKKPEKGTKQQGYWFLKLPKPVCIDLDTTKPDLNMAQKDIDLFEVEVNQDMYNKYKNLIGKQVRVTGTLFGAIGLRHHTPVVIDNVESIQK